MTGTKEFTFEMLRQRVGADDPSFVVWREEDLFGARNYPVRLDFPACFLCLSGSIRLEVDLRPLEAKAPHVLWFSTNCAIRIQERSEDFCCVGVMLSKDYWRNLLLRESGLGAIAGHNFSAKTDKEETERLFRMYELLKGYFGSDTEEESRNIVVYHLIVGWLYMIRDTGKAHSERSPEMSRGERLFYDFLEMVCRHYKECRQVGFYAERLFITPRHLTTTIRQVSGKSASRWIEEYTVLEAEILLRDFRLTVKDIAYELHFNDQSLFSKFFKRVVGMSPERYRQEMKAERAAGQREA